MTRKLDDKVQRRLGELLTEQNQVISRRQLIALGVSDGVARARLSSGLWQRGFPGTYIAHNGQPSYSTQLWSAVLYAGEGAMASYDSAAYLHGLVIGTPVKVHVTVPDSRRVAPQPGLVVHRSGRAIDQEQPFSSPPRTRVEETVLDLADTKAKPDDVVAVLTNACQRKKTVVVALRTGIEQRRKHRHRRLIDEVLTAIAIGVHSVLEWRYYCDVERAHGLPEGERQVHRRRDGKAEWIDVKYSKFRVIVELDGALYHDGNQKRRVDRARDRAEAVNNVILRYGWYESTALACETARYVASVLATRGWSGKFKRCRRCPQPHDVA